MPSDNSSIPSQSSTNAPRTPHKKLLIGSGIGVCAVLLVALFAYQRYGLKQANIDTRQPAYVEQYQKVPPSPKPPLAPTIFGEDQANKASDACGNSTITEYGAVSSQNDILVYVTECIIKVHPDNGTDSLMRFYVRDARGTFNRKVFEVLNTPAFGGSTWAQLGGMKNDKIIIHRAESSSRDRVFDEGGNEVKDFSDLEQRYNYSRLSLSPAGTYLAVDYMEEKAGQVDIKYVGTGEVRSLAFPDVGIAGVRVAGWSNDEKILYVAGGLYEFSARAKLWKVMIDTGEMIAYKGLDSFVFPVQVFPQDGVAFVSNHGVGWDTGDAKPVDTYLFQVNLADGKKSLLIKEKAKLAFNELVKLGNQVFYDLDGQIKAFDMVTRQSRFISAGPATLFSIVYSDQEGWLVLYERENYKFYFAGEDKEIIIGSRGTDIGFQVPTNNREYVMNMVGVIRADK